MQFPEPPSTRAQIPVLTPGPGGAAVTADELGGLSSQRRGAFPPRLRSRSPWWPRLRGARRSPVPCGPGRHRGNPGLHRSPLPPGRGLLLGAGTPAGTARHPLGPPQLFPRGVLTCSGHADGLPALNAGDSVSPGLSAAPRGSLTPAAGEDGRGIKGTRRGRPAGPHLPPHAPRDQLETLPGG